MKVRRLFLLLACFAVLSSGCAFARRAKVTPGANVVVQQTKGAQIKGELVGVRPDAVVLKTKQGPATVPISDILILWTVKEMSANGKTALALGGVVGGLVLGISVGRGLTKDSEDWGNSIAVGLLSITGGMLVGEGIAVLIGTRTRKGTIFDFKDKSPEEIERMLAELKKLARVPDYR